MSKNTFDIFEGLPDYAVMYLQDQCRQYLTVPGVKEYVERTYNGFLQAGYSKEEAEYAVKRIVESKTLVFIDKMNQARERAWKENRGVLRIRNQLRSWIEHKWKYFVLWFRIRFLYSLRSDNVLPCLRSRYFSCFRKWIVFGTRTRWPYFVLITLIFCFC